MAKKKTAPDKNPLVSVVILNWHGTEDTIRCVESLKNVDYSNLELVIVDNEFSSDSKRQLEAITFPRYTYVPSVKNLGFTGGEILGYRHTKGQYIVILNNDAIIEKNAINEFLSTFSRDEKIAVVGGRSYLLDDEGKKQGMLHYTHQRVDPVTAEVTTYMKDDNTERDVSNVSGACVMMRRTVIEECGYFDNSFFAYFEETDLFSRFRRAGWRIVFNPKVVIWHKMGASTRNKKYMYNYLMLKNQFNFAYKNFDAHYLRLYRTIFHRHVRRSFLVYVKKLGKVSKDDIIHKARVDAYIKVLTTYFQRRKARRTVQSVSESFSLNEKLFTDNPLPISIFVDATSATDKQIKTLQHNLSVISRSSIKPDEVIVVSKEKAIQLPQTEALVRYENVVDKGIFSMSPLDFFFMASNNDLLLFANQELLDKQLSEDNIKKHESYLKKLYTLWSAQEVFAIVKQNTSKANRLNLSQFINNPYTIEAIKKSALTNHLAEQTEILTITSTVLTDVLGRCIAQCLPVLNTSDQHSLSIYGLPKGVINYQYEPLLRKPMVWRFKQSLTNLHLWGISSKILRKVRRVITTHYSSNKEQKTATKAISYSSSFPVIINSRDRYEPLVTLLHFLESLGHTRIMLVDNDSTYPPLLQLFETTPHQVVRLGRNGMHKSPWESMGVRFAAKESPYILSDPDILPEATYPQNPFRYFTDLLNKYPDVNKVGFGLHIDDIPDHFTQKQAVLSWESRYWLPDIALEDNVYKTSVDTTLALYRPKTWWFLDPSIRTGGQYQAYHEPWYQDSQNPTEDFMFYRMRASRNVSTWGFDSLPKHHIRALRKEGFIDELIDEEED